MEGFDPNLVLVRTWIFDGALGLVDLLQRGAIYTEVANCKTHQHVLSRRLIIRGTHAQRDHTTNDQRRDLEVPCTMVEVIYSYF